MFGALGEASQALDGGGMRVKVRGRVFASVWEAARWAGVEPRTVYSALSRGTLDTLGMGAGRKKEYRERYGECDSSGFVKGRARRLVLAGIEFESIRAAERWLGVRKGYLQQVLRRLETGSGAGVGGEAWARVVAMAEIRATTGDGAEVTWEGGRTAVRGPRIK